MRAKLYWFWQFVSPSLRGGSQNTRARYCPHCKEAVEVAAVSAKIMGPRTTLLVCPVCALASSDRDGQFRRKHDRIAIAPRSDIAEPLQPERFNNPSVSRSHWGRMRDGALVDIYILRNSKGMEARITNYGATLVGLTVPDRAGKFDDIVLGFDSLKGYLSRSYLREAPYFGATIGRCANRIERGTFLVNGASVSLSVNNPPNHLHGGNKGFDKVVWEARAATQKEASVQLTYRSKAGDEGYPGNLRLTVVYTLTDDALEVQYSGIADANTVLNPTNHSYFNLKGAGEGNVLGHFLKLRSNRFTPIDANSIPIGELRSVKGTPFDFTSPVEIGARIENDDEQLIAGKGYDHNFALDNANGTLSLAAQVFEPTTGRCLEVWTTEPGIQVYTGNHLRGNLVGKRGKRYTFRGGLCLETQHFPDSPNQNKFPSIALQAGETYTSRTVYRFTSTTNVVC